MAQSIHSFLRNNHSIANVTLRALGQTGSSTGGSHCLNHDLSMTGGINGLRIAVAAVGAGIGHDTGLVTAGSLGHNSFVVVAQGRDFGLLNGGNTTYRALLAIGQTGGGAGCGSAGNDFLGMCNGGDGFLGNGHGTADGTLLAIGQTGGGAGCGSAGNDFLGMCNGGNGLLSNGHGTADGAVLALGQTGFVTGRFDRSIHNLSVRDGGNGFLSNGHGTADGAVLALGQTGGSTGGSYCSIHNLSVAGGFDGFLQSSVTQTTVINGHAGLGTGGRNHIGVDTGIIRIKEVFARSFLGNNILLIGISVTAELAVVTDFLIVQAVIVLDDLNHFQVAFLLGGPCGAIRVPLVGVTDNSISSCGILAAAVVQLQRSNRDLGCIKLTFGTLDNLISMGGSTGNSIVSHLAGSLGGVDIGTAGGGVGIALHDQLTVQIHGNVNDDIRSCTVVGTARGIAHRSEGGIHIVGVYIGAPLVCVIDIQIGALGNAHGCALVNDDSCTGHQCHILSHGDGASGLGTEGDIAVQGQHIAFRIDGDTTNLHADAVDTDFALIDGQLQPILGTVIVFGHAAAGQGEQAAGTDELHRCGLVRVGHVNTGSCHQRCAGIQRHGNLNILHIVLGEGENLVGIRLVGHGSGNGAAAEVGDLHILIDFSTALDRNGTGTLDEAPGVQLTAVANLHGGAAVHVDHTHRTGGAAAVGIAAVGCMMDSAHIDSTVDGDVSAVSHGQGPECGGLDPGGIVSSAGIAHSGGVDRVAAVVGNQQSIAGGDSIIACGQDTVVSHHNQLGTGRSSSICFRQIFIMNAAHGENCSIDGDKYGVDCSRFLQHECVCGGGGNILTSGFIVPGNKLVICSRSCHQVIAYCRGF